MDDQPEFRPDSFEAHAQWIGNAFRPPEPVAPVAMSAEEMKRIYGLLDRSKVRSQVRQIAEEYLGGSATRLESLAPVIQPLIRPLRHSWRERQVAAWILGIARLDPGQRQFAIESLVHLLERRLELDPADITRKALWRMLQTSVVLTLPWLLSGFRQDVPIPVVSLCFVSFPVWLVVCEYYNQVTSAQIAAEAARSLGNLRATEALNALVTVTQTGRRFRRPVRAAARQALPSVLSTLTADHYGQIRSDIMQGLCRLLQTGDENLALAVVNALALVGDTMALAPIEKLAAGDGRAAREPRVHQAAQAALPQIQARIARARDPHQLLRGSSMPMTPTDQLLRPSAEVSPTDPYELLRAGADPNWQGTEQEVAFVVRVLQDLQAHGDARAATYVEQIAANPAADARVRYAAQQCLPALRAHQELERYSPTQTESQPNILEMRSNS